LLVAALMSGLTIGLMSLDMNNLYILKLSGSPEQRRNAALVEPLRRRGHLLLCTLLIGNMLANETIPIVLDQVC
jgi:metal transporter CNNM